MKAILTALFLTASIYAVAQTIKPAATKKPKKINFSIEAGGNISTIHGINAWKSNPSTPVQYFTPSKIKAGVNVGFNMQWAFAKKWALQTGATYITKGTGKGIDNTRGVGEPQPIDYFVIRYVTIPLNILYTPGANKRFYTGAGFYYAPALSAAQHFATGGSRAVRLTDYTYDKGLPDYPWVIKKADAGINVLAGYKLNHNLYATFNAQWGLKNICTQHEGFFDNSGSHYKTTCYAVNIGYRF